MRKKSLIVALIVFLYDLLIKHIINKLFYYGKLKTVIPKFFYLTKVYNEGAAWSTFSGSIYLLIGIAVLAFFILFYYQKSFLENKKNMLAFGLTYGGLLGNLVDRIFRGHVIDYLKFNFGTYEFPIFNLADIAIVIGFALIIYGIFKGEDKNGSKSRSK